MGGIRPRAAWIGSAIVLAGLVLVVSVRLLTGSGHTPPATPASAEGGVVAGRSEDLAASARRLRTLYEEMGRTREQLAAVQARATAKRENVTTLNRMLAEDSLTQCPAFLRDETTVRALQQVIREAAASANPASSGNGSLNTAASVARERLRLKLETLRDQLLQEVRETEAEAEALRQHLRGDSEELDRLRRQVNEPLQSRTEAAPLPAV